MGKYTYNKAVGEKAAERRTHREVDCARLVTSLEKFVPEDSDDLKVVVGSVALSDPTDPESAVPGSNLKEYFTMPLDNPDVEGHNFLDNEWSDMQARNWAEFAHAMWPDEIPLRPMQQERTPDGKRFTGPYFFRGEEIDKDDYGKYLQEAVDLAGEKAGEVLDAIDDEADLGSGGLGVVGTGYFAAVRHKKDKKTGQTRVNQVAYRADLPPHWKLETDPAKFVEVSRPAPASKAKKAPPKKTTKKKTSKRK